MRIVAAENAIGGLDPSDQLDRVSSAKEKCLWVPVGEGLRQALNDGALGGIRLTVCTVKLHLQQSV